jgi:adenine-specific DNA-methyltransferase
VARIEQPELFDESAQAVRHRADTPGVSSEKELISLAVALGARTIHGWSDAEEQLCVDLPSFSQTAIERFRQLIQEGTDPLGDIFCHLRPASQRRAVGATFTPLAIVEVMLGLASMGETPKRIVDPGTGSGRYLAMAGSRFKSANLIGVEVDPLACLLARANLSVRNLAGRSEIILGDYRSITLPRVPGRTLYIGNPPYVRHHQISPVWKRWFSDEAASQGFLASQLAGLHVHFFLTTALKAAVGDTGVFITAAEWMDVNYGSLVRELFLGRLGGKRIVVIEPAAQPFPDAATTAAITQFEIGSASAGVRMKRAKDIAALRDSTGHRLVHRERLRAVSRWSPLTRAARKIPQGYIELGDLCRVHRGQVTGSNQTWIAGQFANRLPKSVLFRTVTKARELFQAGEVLSDSSGLRYVIDLPIDLDTFDSEERAEIDAFLLFARRQGAHLGYVAANRKAWWSVGLKEPAPILATYMARRPPAFVRNQARARHINIAHGLYPRGHMSDVALSALADHLSNQTSLHDGRTYAGGLTKFEPREMERLLVPDLKVLGG